MIEKAKANEMGNALQLSDAWPRAAVIQGLEPRAHYFSMES